jgi:membrane-associated protease RseP (regulator of RpoE activity)
LYWLPYFFFAVVIIMLSHELAHGIVARLEGIPILSSGVLAFLVFFGAFVEQDEKEFEKASILDRLRMLGAGSSTNLIIALLATLLMTSLFIPTPAGVLIQEVNPNGPADKAGLQQWDVIKAMNGTSISSLQDYSDYMSKVKPNTTLVLTVLHDNADQTRYVTTAASPINSSQTILDIRSTSYLPNRLGLDQYTGINLYWALFWIYLLGVSVAIFNMLPAAPFDGERVLYYPLASLVKKRKRELRWALNVVFWGLFVLNIALSLWRYGLFRI